MVATTKCDHDNCRDAVATIIIRENSRDLHVTNGKGVKGEVAMRSDVVRLNGKIVRLTTSRCKVKQKNCKAYDESL
jgi:hypothetical protein